MGTSSAAKTVALTNTGTVALAIASIATASGFTETNNCGGTVAPGGACTVNVKFAPIAAGSRSGSLTIADNATGSPQTVSLSGQAK